ncbi:type-F conjugative transfer system mating-pair stabilization protein TraN [Yersinia enterocolitica]
MKTRFSLLFGMITLLLSSSIVANDQFNAGANWASQHKGQGSNAISGFDPAASLPNYTDSPPETGYYGGVTSPGIDLNGPGTSAMNSSEVGNLITESILNTPPDIKPSLDAPFIAEGLGMKDKAETITGGGFEGCVDQPASFTEITTHQCLRDTKVEQFCTRTARIEGEWVDDVQDKYVVIDSTQLRFYAYGNGKNREDGARTTFIVPEDVNGPILSAVLTHSGYGSTYLLMQILGTEVNLSDGSRSFTPAQTSLTAGQSIPINIILSALPTASVNLYHTQKARFKIVLRVRTGQQVFKPGIAWTEVCPFDKAEGALTSTECVEPGGDKTIYHNGKPYTLYQECWAYKDTYLTQNESEGTCGEYIKDSACTVIRSECADSVDGFCVSQRVTYSCERKNAGNGKICGGEFFCTDGSCAQAQTGTSNMFGQAVSALAAVAAAGKDVAELNGGDVRAFTGEAKSCKKFAAGFNNCCKDSGWGQDLGLSSCSSDEKALGEAKNKKLTVYVGEYCSKKVLGVCLEKKRGYCVFDSKLARIVQEQGRHGQLGIGFGSGEHPDCRGITVDELQRLDFGVMNFSDFYSDLEAGSNIPEDQALLEKAQAIIKDKLAGEQQP